MAQVLLLIMAASVAISSLAQGFVLPHFAQLMGADYEYAEETPAAPTPTPSNIMRITHPNELRKPAVAEVTRFIDAAAGTEQSASSNQVSVDVNAFDANKSTEAAVIVDGQRRQGKTLTYTELDKLLANWQLDKERNAYEMQTGNHNRIAASYRY